ncbi:MerR family transcriptional regulator [Nocardioides mangrovicus]|uniref:helix-turn-helix domain-containing protein n=1 Tax=Nocardioides mangrovicus TaxID=2478913 RepID=UPI0011C3A172|nr:helix-turn-helix domain-containing protein [Nocardioides mangrovicus]
MPDEPNPLAFLTLDAVAEKLATSRTQVYALVRRGEVRSTTMGGREPICGVAGVEGTGL